MAPENLIDIVNPGAGDHFNVIPSGFLKYNSSIHGNCAIVQMYSLLQQPPPLNNTINPKNCGDFGGCFVRVQLKNNCTEFPHLTGFFYSIRCAHTTTCPWPRRNKKPFLFRSLRSQPYIPPTKATNLAPSCIPEKVNLINKVIKTY